MSHIIIGIHGLSNKPAPELLEEGWESAIIEGLEKNLQIYDTSINFLSVYWADRLYDRYDENPDLYKPAEAGAIKTYEDSWLDAVREKSFDWVGDIIDSAKKNFGMDDLASKVLELKLKDLSRYYQEEPLRKKLRKLLSDQILQADRKGLRIMVVAHSMGTIIAYDVLRALGKEHPRLIIDNFVTLGSPLGLPHVKYKIALENSLVRTPSIVKKWLNFADKRDPVALDTHLAGDYQPNDMGVKVVDDLVANDWGGIHHKSYGYLRTPEVSRVIKNFI